MSEFVQGTISFAGEVTISSIAQAHEQLAAVMREQTTVIVDVEALDDTDLTFVQLMESARRKARDTGVRLSLGQPATGPLLEVLQRGGFLDDETSDRAKFWLQGAAQ